MARVVEYPYSGLSGPERELVQLLHGAGEYLTQVAQALALLTLGGHGDVLGSAAERLGRSTSRSGSSSRWLAAEVVTGDALTQQVRCRWLTPAAAACRPAGAGPADEDVA